MLQVRITDPDGSNATILSASQRSIFKRINSSDEGGKFRVPKNDPKADVLNPDTGGDTKFWEMWDTETNERLNYGPITSITEDANEWVVEGRGRSALLEDFYSSRDIFYGKIDPTYDRLRFEYVSLLPHVSTLVPTTISGAAQDTVFGPVTIDEKYYGLSTKSKDNIIDDITAPLAPLPIRTYQTTDSFWSGMSRNDAIIVDLGENFPLSYIKLIFPWWTSKVRYASAGRDYSLAIATASGATITTLQGRDFGPFTEIYRQGPDSRIIGGNLFSLGSTYSGFYDPIIYGNVFNVALDQPGPIDTRYIRVNIDKTHMWGGSFLDNAQSVDMWNYQCNPDYVVGDDPGSTRPASSKTLDDPIPDVDLKPENDCHASVVEIQAARKILDADLIRPLALQRIDNNNLQITYYHVPDSSEITTTSSGYKKFEPGSFFRNFSVSWSGANTAYTKFFNSDCTNCYPDGFNFGVVDQNNTLVYHSDNTSGTASIRGHIFTKQIMMKGSATATVTSVDSWPATYDPLSYGASYSWTTVANDYARIHFRGQSFKWYATIPDDKTPATVKIEIRSKTTGSWSSWSTLESSYVLSHASATSVYEISYESGILVADTVYEIKITNLDGGFCSIDSIGGYWSASMSEYNEDSQRVSIARPEFLTQIYDSRFSHGTMYKWNQSNWSGFGFEGDRILIVSAKGRYHGVATISILNYNGQPSQYDDGNIQHLMIPGGDPVSGYIDIDLDTGKRGAEIAQYIIFDSNDYWPDGLPWGYYSVGFYYIGSKNTTYNAYASDSDNFVERCRDCKTPTGSAISTNEYIYLDGYFAHEKIGLSVKFIDQHHLDQLTSLTEALQVEWDITEKGLRIEPRIGTDTNLILREGQNVVVKYQIVHDATKIATQLLSSGADIDGLPLSTVTEDRANRRRIGRSITRKQDFRNLSSYTQMIGLSRTELKKRRYSEKRMTVTYSGPRFTLNQGDTFILYTKKLGKLRVRIDYLERNETDSGTEWPMEVSKWPLIED